MLRTLLFSTLYPSSSRPGHGIFVETRLRHLLATGQVSTQVLAPVPWFPFCSLRSGQYALIASTPLQEIRYSIHINHPRYFLIPKFGMSLAPFLMAASLRSVFDRMMAGRFPPDLIDAHYFYPDGVAAVLLAHRYHKPVVITARGTDLNYIPRYTIPRWMIRFASNEAAAIIAVCKALKDVLIELHVPEKKITVLRNGVDLLMFRPPHNRDEIRAKLSLDRTTLLSVGYLIPRKGHDLIIEALKELPECFLLIAGSGPMGKNLRNKAKSIGVENRVRFLGQVPHENLADIYGAADIFVLASDREGWPNVLLESMACGTPVLATKAWGTPEVVASAEAGILIDNRDAKSIADAVRRLLSTQPDRKLIRKYAENFSWDATNEGQLGIFRQITELGSA